MPATGRGRRQPDDRGMVTVEAAIAMASFVLVLGLALYGLAAAADQVRCVDAAREAARLVARGEPDRARATAERIAPPGADITIGVDGEHVRVDVRASPAGGLLPGLRLHGEAFAIREPGG